MKPLSCLLGACLIFLSILPVVPAHSETRYVSDMLIIILRDGKGEDAKRIRTLKTGTPVEILAQEPPYLKIRTEEGETGYIKAQYLSSLLPKKTIIANLEQEKEHLNKKLARLEETLNKRSKGLMEKKENLVRESQELKAEAAELQEKLALSQENLKAVTTRYDNLAETSKRVIETATERDRLKEENSLLAAELEETRAQKIKMVGTAMIKWFLAGAGVFLIGWLAGVISRKKRTSL